jgi:hypothetical protein
MLLHRLDWNFLPVKDTRGQSSLSLGLFKDLLEVLNLSGSWGSDHRDGYIVTDVVDQFVVRNNIFVGIYTYLSDIDSKIPNRKLSYPQLFFLKPYVTHIASLSN